MTRVFVSRNHHIGGIVQHVLFSTPHPTFPPPGVPHLTFRGKSTLLSFGDRITICLTRGCVLISRGGKRILFRDQNGVETDTFEFSTVFNAVVAEQQITLMCMLIGLRPERVILDPDDEKTRNIIIFELGWG